MKPDFQTDSEPATNAALRQILFDAFQTVSEKEIARDRALDLLSHELRIAQAAGTTPKALNEAILAIRVYSLDLDRIQRALVTAHEYAQRLRATLNGLGVHLYDADGNPLIVSPPTPEPPEPQPDSPSPKAASILVDALQSAAQDADLDASQYDALILYAADIWASEAGTIVESFLSGRPLA